MVGMNEYIEWQEMNSGWQLGPTWDKTLLVMVRI